MFVGILYCMRVNVYIQDFCVALKHNILKHHDLYTFPPKGEYLEELIVKSFKDININDVVWDSGSHKKGADICVLGENISIKTGKCNKSSMILSSHRTTKYSDFDSKFQFISQHHEDSYMAVNNANLYYFPANIIKNELINSQFHWEEIIKNTKSLGWKYISPNNFNFTIRKSMSDQLWIRIPLLNLQQYKYNLK